MPRGRYPKPAVSLESDPKEAQRAYCKTLTTESSTMSKATNASRHRARLHILRDRLQRAVRDVKRGIVGAKERVAAHTEKRAKYRAANP